MSWIEKQRTAFVVATGDGKQYPMTWRPGSYSYEWNIARFAFNGVSGELVPRSEPLAREFPLVLVYQGEDHLEQAETFRISANDKRAWTIQHPQYGAIVAQPSSISFNNEFDNVTTITCTVIETIGTDAVAITVSIPDKIADDKLIADQSMSTTFAESVPDKKVNVIKQLQGNVAGIFANVSKNISDSTDASEFFNKYNEVNALINNTVWDAIKISEQIQNYISMPYRFFNTLADRIKMFQLQAAFLLGTSTRITTRDGKKVFENHMGTVVTAATLASVTNIISTFRNKQDVLDVINSLHGLYTSYIDTLDSLQTDNGGDPDSYIPDPDTVNNVTILVSYALSNLFAVAQNARQEYRITLENDSDPIQLAHRFYGLLADDSTINEFIDSNNLTREELFEIKKGREIVYYV